MARILDFPGKNNKPHSRPHLDSAVHDPRRVRSGRVDFEKQSCFTPIPKREIRTRLYGN